MSLSNEDIDRIGNVVEARLVEFLKSSHASEQGADTKRLDWLLSNDGRKWLEENIDYLRAGHRKPFVLNAIDAAMSQRPTKK